MIAKCVVRNVVFCTMLGKGLSEISRYCGGLIFYSDLIHYQHCIRTYIDIPVHSPPYLWFVIPNI